MDYIKRLLIVFLFLIPLTSHAQWECDGTNPTTNNLIDYTQPAQTTQIEGTSCYLSITQNGEVYGSNPKKYYWLVKIGRWKKNSCPAGNTSQFTFFEGWGFTPVDVVGNIVPGTEANIPIVYCDGACTHSYQSVDTCYIYQISRTCSPSP